jgi:hypothetical protein
MLFSAKYLECEMRRSFPLSSFAVIFNSKTQDISYTDILLRTVWDMVYVASNRAQKQYILKEIPTFFVTSWSSFSFNLVCPFKSLGVCFPTI